MAGVFRGKALEAFKFSIYIAMPIFTVYSISQPDFLRKAIDMNKYIVYPPEGPRPPSGTQEEMLEGLKKLKPSKETMALVDELLANQVQKRLDSEQGVVLSTGGDSGAPKQTWTQWTMGYPATK